MARTDERLVQVVIRQELFRGQVPLAPISYSTHSIPNPYRAAAASSTFALGDDLPADPVTGDHPRPCGLPACGHLLQARAYSTRPPASTISCRKPGTSSSAYFRPAATSSRSRGPPQPPSPSEIPEVSAHTSGSSPTLTAFRSRRSGQRTRPRSPGSLPLSGPGGACFPGRPAPELLPATRMSPFLASRRTRPRVPRMHGAPARVGVVDGQEPARDDLVRVHMIAELPDSRGIHCRHGPLLYRLLPRHYPTSRGP